jgi:hypothetical protein
MRRKAGTMPRTKTHVRIKRKRRPGPPLPKPTHRTPAEPQPRLRQEANGTWAVIRGKTVVKDGFPSMAAAWAFVDRKETHALSDTDASAVRYGRYRLP